MLLSFENVSFGYAGVPVVENAAFRLHEGEKVGLIGENGAGKTTLLRLMTGELSPDAGTVFLKSGLRTGYLEQDAAFDSDATVYAAMEEVFAEDRLLIARLTETQAALETAKDGEYRILSARCESLLNRIAARDSHHVDVKIKTVLNGMGFEAFYHRAVGTMSGGEKTKLKLCRLLLEAPELLILDEPTNHLDLKTLFWLEDYLSSYRGALLVVSHDRYFLDRLTLRTLELERGKLYSYSGNYSKYRLLKEERVKQAQRDYEKQREEEARLKDYAARNRVRASTAKSARSRENRLERLAPLEKPALPPPAPRFSFSYDAQPEERVLEARRFTLTAGGKTLLEDADFTLLRGQKCALVGDNGTGKTTLIKFLLSRDPQIRTGRFVRIGYYDQENAALPPDECVLNAFWSSAPRLSQTEARALLARAGLDAEDVQKRVCELSGGLKVKLSLALLEARRANVLFLDEPTNHLDLPARESLEEALRAFGGTLLFVSHDRRFIEAVANSVLLLEGGRLRLFSGGYGEFLAAQTKPAPPAPERQKPAGGFRSKEERALKARARAREREIEARLEEIEREEAQLNDRLAKSAADYLAVREITVRLEELRAESDALYKEYEAYL